MATMTVSIKEAVTINGKDQGGTYAGFTTTITQVEKRLLNDTTTEVTLYETAAAQNDAEDEVYGGASWDHDSVKYVRITNLAGNSNFIYIIIQNSASDEAVFKVFGTESLLLYRHTGTFEAIAASGATATNVADIQKVSIQADTSTQAVELFLASDDAA